MPFSTAKENNWHNSFIILEAEETFTQLREENAGNREYSSEV
jgi:hypothetical protein